jgi:hypothetical protein
MPAVNFSPIFNGWQGFTPTGIPLALGWVQTYIAGTTTPLPTYTTNAGNIVNANPIPLLADGRPPNEIWLDAAYSYKFALLDSLLNQIATYDNITGIDNSVPAALTEWVVSGLTPAYVNATTFTLAGNQTALFEIGRRVRYTLGAGQYTGSITNSVFGALTTITLVTDSIPLDASLSAVDYGLLDALKPSVPTAFKSAVTAPTIASTATITAGTNLLAPAQPGFSAYTTIAFAVSNSGAASDVIYGTEEYDHGGCYNSATGVFTAQVAGRYQINFSIQPYFLDTSAAGSALTVLMLKNGASLGGRASLKAIKTIAGVTFQIGSPMVTFAQIYNLAVNDTLKWTASYSDAVNNQCPGTGAAFSAELLG